MKRLSIAECGLRIADFSRGESTRRPDFRPLASSVGLILFLSCFTVHATIASGPETSVPLESAKVLTRPAHNWIDQPQSEADAKSVGCLQCHAGVEPMHKNPAVVLGCTDCHGGNPAKGLTKELAHPKPLNPEFWRNSANPVDSNVLLNHESPEWIRFVNPGDLRVAQQSCGLCHDSMIHNVELSMMNHGAMLWGAALYNNGAWNKKNYSWGSAYSREGEPLTLINPEPVTPEMTKKYGILPELRPLPRFVIGQPSNTLRIFEKGGSKPPELGIPYIEEPPGRPVRRVSDRGLGTKLRIDPVWLNLQKTRLNDPLLHFMGTNDHPGDYRSSGCTACHVPYANDRSPHNSGWMSKFGNQGLSFSKDPTIPKNERGHPITHQFTRSIPSSQCMNCHMHQGNLFVNPYLGYTWWDQESDGELMYPKVQKDPTPEELAQSLMKNPEAAAAKGLWGDLTFLEKVSELNPKMQHTQFADYHGHGWVFRGVFKKDKKGELLDLQDNLIQHDDPKKWAKAVHLKDIHLEKGMQCVDCHFLNDVHGNGKLYGEPRNATSIECWDCHGTVDKRPNLLTSGNAGKFNLMSTSTPWGPRFVWEGNKLYQYSNMSPDVRWEVKQTIDTITPGAANFNLKSYYAKTLHRDGKALGGVPTDDKERAKVLAHDNSTVNCYVCHTSWATSCFGCHLPLKANMRFPNNKFEGVKTRSYTSYNPQVVRDDVFMLGIDGTVKGNRLAVIRSSSAVIVGSQNANREWVYNQQQTISAEGYSGQAFNPHFAHTTSSVGTTKNCSECHLSEARDNNAWMTQLLGYGTGTVNFFGRYAYVGAGTHGFESVVWTEEDEPQAAIGSHLHKLAYPRNYAEFEKGGRILKTAYEHKGENVVDIMQRGEYVYTANGPGGLQVFDIASVDNKGFSERIVDAPVSPLGQRLYVKSPNCTSVAAPTTLGVDPARHRDPENEEQPIHLSYAYLFATDTVEGLFGTFVATLLDGNPQNNFLKKDIVFNPDNKFKGAQKVIFVGHHLMLLCPNGLYVIDIDKPTTPKIVGELTGGVLKNPRDIAIQFQYAFVTDDDGLKVLDITNRAKPKLVATQPLKHAHKLYVARTYCYVANGEEGLAIIDIEKPFAPKLRQMFNADGQINDLHAVQIGSISASMYALLADGHNGFRVVQLISPDTVYGHMGFSPAPAPKLIATYPMEHAIAVGRGLDRDRVVDEDGHQTVVFGRRGSRPFNTQEMSWFYKHKYGDDIYRVTDPVLKDGKLYKKDGTLLIDPISLPTSDPSRVGVPPAKSDLPKKAEAPLPDKKVAAR